MRHFKTKLYFLFKRNSFTNVIYFIFFLFKKALKLNFNALEPKNTSIDLIITTVEKDFKILDICIESALKNINHKISKIFIISNDNIKPFCQKNDYIYVDENKLLGYNKEKISYSFEGINRSGWLFQQLLKLSADKISHEDNFLVLDSDTILINRHTFIDKNGNFIFYISEEWNKDYFETFEKILKEKTTSRLSFVSHMMIFNKENLVKFKKEIESKNNNKWDQVIIDNINKGSMSFFSEYESYGNWCLKNIKSKIKTVPGYNKSLGSKEVKDYNQLKSRYNKKYNSISFHNYANN